MENKTTLPKPEPKYKKGDFVLFNSEKRMIINHAGYWLIEEKWVPFYVAGPVNKKGDNVDKRILNGRFNRFKYQVSEENLTSVNE